MTRLEFNALVERLEQRFDGRPAALSRATAFWLVFGYAILFSGLFLGVVGGSVLIALAFRLDHPWAYWLAVIGGVLILVAARIYAPLIWSSRSTVKELVLSSDQAPGLQQLIEELRLAVGCRPFQRIVLTAELNAGVLSEPRFGLLGGARQVLQLGLPLLEAVSTDEFRAVLAHEFVHHSRAHGWFSVWVYRVRRVWERVYTELESGARYRSVRWVRWFLRWYWPRMHARLFLLCREHEYQADRFAADYVSASASTTGLYRIETFDSYLDHAFWPMMQREAEKSATPPRDLMSRMLTALAVPSRPELGDWCATTTVARLTDTADTHPAWTERATALGEDPLPFTRLGFPRRPVPNAAQTLLGNDWSRLSQQISGLWAETVQEVWTAQNRRMCGLRRRLQQIAPLVEQRPNDVSLRWEQASLVKELDGVEAVPPLLEYLHNLEPPHRAATFELGQITLSRGDPRGAALLAAFVDQHRDSYYEPACQVLGQYYRLTGRFDEMREMEARLDGRDAWADWIREGHRHVARHVPCIPHGLEAAQLAPLVELLDQQNRLDAAWLARAGNQAHGAPPLYLLCVSTSSSFWEFWAADADQRLARGLVTQVSLPGRVLIIARRGPDRRLARRVRATPESQIFPPV